jgi:hypothetical protein
LVALVLIFSILVTRSQISTKARFDLKEIFWHFIIPWPLPNGQLDLRFWRQKMKPDFFSPKKKKKKGTKNVTDYTYLNRNFLFNHKICEIVLVNFCYFTKSSKVLRQFIKLFFRCVFLNKRYINYISFFFGNF